VFLEQQLEGILVLYERA